MRALTSAIERANRDGVQGKSEIGVCMRLGCTESDGHSGPCTPDRPVASLPRVDEATLPRCESTSTDPLDAPIRCRRPFDHRGPAGGPGWHACGELFWNDDGVCLRWGDEGPKGGPFTPAHAYEDQLPDDAQLAVIARRLQAVAAQDVMADILAERARQNRKWGEHNHPSGDRVLIERKGGCTPKRMCQEYGLPSEFMAKAICDRAAHAGSLTWPAIAVEELSEAVSAAADGTERRCREELVQLAAVVVAWIECIDRRKLEKLERHIERAFERPL